ncbi:zinc-dependent alcohol dehydrogenase [Qaidamihabitans albus]|uniref:zinc-dependent alcohol dehydrogenase n=1 Tax=Qaidamihabitans albus TaxID=2795733 RepID=UPI0018F25E13|nr:alcohol dehydrogenase catalytic domain-containing protein [Qaidamihabitans albus]
MLTPVSSVAGAAALERDASRRTHRLVDAARDRFAQRRRPTRARMRALMVGPGGRLAFHDVPTPPPPGPTGALVRPLAMATCDLDRPLALGRTPFPLPLALGHECVAEVMTVGAQVATVRPGDRVVVPFQISCGACGACRAGLTGNCTGVPPISMYGFGVGGGHWGGAFAEQLAIPFADAMLVPLPDGIDPVAAASVADTVCDGYRHVAPHLPALLKRDPAAEILIIAGTGRRPVFSASTPLYAGQVARALGARQVTLVDSRQAVRAHAERLGLHTLAPGELRGRPPAPLTVDLSGSRRGLWTALTHTAPDGTCSCAGILHRSVRIPTGLMFARNATLHLGRAHTRTLIPAVLELITDGHLRPQDVTTNVAPFDQSPTALREHILGDDTKTVITIP